MSKSVFELANDLMAVWAKVARDNTELYKARSNNGDAVQ